MYLRDNSRLAQTVAALPPFECSGLLVRVALCHIVLAHRGQTAGLHRHGYMEMTYLTDGLIRYATESEAIPVPAGNSFLMPPGIAHRWDAKGKSSVLFGFMLELQDQGESTAVSLLDDAVRHTHHVLTFNSLTAKTLQLLAHSVATERNFRPELAAPLMQALLTMTFRQIVSRTKAAVPASPAARQRIMFEQARTYIDANLEHVIYRDELAEFIGIGGRQLNRIFRTQGGRSVTAYLLERRLERARALLAKGQAVKEVAYACGFSSPSYFSRFFKHYTGRAPSHTS